MNLERVKQVSKDTLVPLGLVLTILTSAVGYGKLQRTVENHDSDIVSMKTDYKDDRRSFNRILNKLDRRLYRLENKNGLKNIEPLEEF